MDTAVKKGILRLRRATLVTEDSRRQFMLSLQQRDRKGQLEEKRAIALTKTTVADNLNLGTETIDSLDDEDIPMSFAKNAHQGKHFRLETLTLEEAICYASGPRQLPRLLRGEIVKYILLLPETMIEVPRELSGWCAYVRPEGEHVVLFCKNKFAVVRNKNGDVFDKFQINMKGISIFDAIAVKFQDAEEPDENNSNSQSDIPFKGQYVVTDSICWQDAFVSDSPKEVRDWLLRSKFSEQPELGHVSHNHERALVLADSISQCTTDQLHDLYQRATHQASSSSHANNDSLVFVHREAHYTAGINPLYLCWRDVGFSRWPVDSQDYLSQSALLTMDNESGALLTEDEVEICRVSSEEVVKWNKKARVKRGKLIVRVNIEDIEISESGVVDFFGVKIVSLSSKSRATAHTLCRIVHQFTLRKPTLAHYRIHFDNIIEASQTGDPYGLSIAVQRDLELEEFE
eukprot:GHVP01017866.1.p1 GENE.GHVP01017866.1~~GHVP01017866.1.p1  ORF type:complete len:459 (+),score=90.78 GHVP01017866.1:100-1476(+)